VLADDLTTKLLELYTGDELNVPGARVVTAISGWSRVFDVYMRTHPSGHEVHPSRMPASTMPDSEGRGGFGGLGPSVDPRAAMQAASNSVKAFAARRQQKATPLS
jgi:hypothetical protein